MNKISNYIIIFLSVVCVALFISNDNKREDNNILRHNIRSLTNENHLLTDDLRNAVAYGESVVLENKELRSEMDIREIEFKEIQERLNSEIIILSDMIANFKPDTIEMSDTLVIIDSLGTFGNEFNYSSECISLSGRNIVRGVHISTFIDDLLISIPINLMIDDKYRVIATSKCEGVNLTFNDCFVNDDTYNSDESKVSIGFHMGVGFQYDIISRNIGFGPQFGIGVSYRLRLF